MISNSSTSACLQLADAEAIVGLVSQKRDYGVIHFGGYGCLGSLMANVETLERLADICSQLAQQLRDIERGKGYSEPAAEECVDLHNPPAPGSVHPGKCEHGQYTDLCPECSPGR